MCTSDFAHSDSAHQRHGSAHQRHDSALHEGTSAFAFRPPPPCARRRGTRCHNGARANPIYIARADYILYIRVRRREGADVLHRAASNDVDNFSVDNPLWITVAGGCRLLRGHRRRRCGGSVNAGTAFRPQDCDFTAWTGRTYIKYMRARDPLRQMCVKPADLTTHSSPSTSAPPRSPDARPQTARCIPRRPHNTFPAEDLRPPPHSDTPSPSTPAPPRSADARPLAARCIPVVLTTHSPPKAFARPHAATRPPSVPLRAQKNGTAQCMCDAECLGRPSLRSVIWVGEPRAVRRRCGALACRRGA